MIRLYRVLPLLIVLALVALIVYGIMSFRYSSDRAKATLIRVFLWLTSILSIGFALITAYAFFEHNDAVTELFGSCLGVTIIGLAITLICRFVFKKNHPLYGEDVAEATIINETLSSRFVDAFKRAFGEALKDTFDPKHRKR